MPSYRRHIKLTYDYHIGTVVVFLRTKRRAWSGMWSTVLVPIYTVSLSLSSGAACFGSRYEPNADTATAATTSSYILYSSCPQVFSLPQLYTLCAWNWNYRANLITFVMCFYYQNLSFAGLNSQSRITLDRKQMRYLSTSGLENVDFQSSNFSKTLE